MQIKIITQALFKTVKFVVEIYVSTVLYPLDAVDAQIAAVVILSPLLRVYSFFITLKIVGLVETFGRFSRLLKPGLNMINPCAE